MKKIITVLVLVLMVFILVACDTNSDRFNSAMKQISGTQGFETVDVKEEDDPTEKPDDPEKKPEAPEPEPVWPAAVPPITEYVKKYTYTLTDNEFRARFIMTPVQLQTWTATLTAEGFVGDPRANHGYIVEYLFNKTNDENYNVTVIINPLDTEWPTEFKEFPEFVPLGEIVRFDHYVEDGGTRILYIQSANEMQEALTVYIQALKRAGFTDMGQGIYAKQKNEITYEFDSNAEIIWDGTTANLYWRIYHV